MPGRSDETAAQAHGLRRLVLADDEAKVWMPVVEPQRPVSGRGYWAPPLRSGQIRLRGRDQLIVVRFPPPKAAQLELKETSGLRSPRRSYFPLAQFQWILFD